MNDQEIKVVCFNLGEEEYAVDVNRVLGVNPMMAVMRLPKAPDFIEGMITIKEKIIPLIDLRKRFDLEAPAKDKAATPSGKRSWRRRIIVAKVDAVKIAFIADNVSGVLAIASDNIEPPSKILEHAAFLKGVGKLEKKLLLLLDLDKILTREETKMLSSFHKTKTEGK